MVVDHLGNEFKTVTAMCKHYGLAHNAYYGRLERGYSLQEALTGRKRVCDHAGNWFATHAEMYRFYGVREQRYTWRREHGWTLEEALTGKRKKVKDHLGNGYRSCKEMCESYGVAFNAYRSRLARGWSMEEALTSKRVTGPGKDVMDHLGNIYPTKAAMCSQYGITRKRFNQRVKAGWSLEQALTMGIGNNPRKRLGKVVDHLGNEYESAKAMCRAYNVSYAAFTYRQKAGYSMKESLMKE